VGASDDYLRSVEKWFSGRGTAISDGYLPDYSQSMICPFTESLELLATEKVTDEMAATLAAGFEALVEVLKAEGSPEGEALEERRYKS
jgi:hypothetical protein